MLDVLACRKILQNCLLSLYESKSSAQPNVRGFRGRANPRLPASNKQGQRASIIAATVSSGSPARITAAATRTITTAATRFLGARFVHLQLPAIHIEPVQFANRL